VALALRCFSQMRTILLIFVFVIGCSKNSFYVMPDDLKYMEPAIEAGQIVSIKKFTARNNQFDIKRFDIVAINNLPNLEGEHILRILGLPGENIQFRDSGFFINDKELIIPHDLSYLNQRLKDAKVPMNKSINIPTDEFFLIGDNIDIAYDSRYFGPISFEKITGIVYAKL